MDAAENQDETVERCGALLVSEDCRELARGFVALVELPLACERPWGFGRVLQELAAYKGGAVAERVVRGALHDFFESETVVRDTGTQAAPENEAELADEAAYGAIACVWILGMLSRSGVAAERCLTARDASEKQNAKELYCNLVGNALKAAHQMAYGTWEEPLPKWKALVYIHGEQTIGAALDSVADFARYSRVFRDAMKDTLEEISLFECFSVFLAGDFLAVISARKADRIRRVMADLAVSLSMSPDSQIWALDKGLLKLVAAIYKATTMRQVRDDNRKEEHPPLFRCNTVLFTLLETPATLSKLRAHNALAGFRPHKRKMNEADPSINVWRSFEAQLQGVPLQWPTLAQKCKEVRPPEIVCSWKLCSAGQEVDAGKKFGKCALCQVSRYCR